jgi:RNA polymerase sigma-70 factor (ECF subfamily)
VDNSRFLRPRGARVDDDALELLVRTYHDRVYRFGLRVCQSAFDADDAVQDAFIKLARRPDVAGHASVLSWLMSVVRNACVRMLRPFTWRRRAPGGLGEALELPTDEPSPELALERWQLVSAVHQAIATLDPLYREVLVLRDLEGRDGAEVAASLGIAEPAMTSRLYRARQMLRAQISSIQNPRAGMVVSSRDRAP